MCKFSSKSGGVPFQPLGDLTWNDPKANITCSCAVPLYIISLHILALFWVVFDFRLNNCTCLCKDYKPSIEFINDKYWAQYQCYK